MNPNGTNSFSEINLDGYRSIPFAGSTTECSYSGKMIFESSDLKKYPTFKYYVDTYERTCFHNGLTDQLLGCSSRKNGECILSNWNYYFNFIKNILSKKI